MKKIISIALIAILLITSNSVFAKEAANKANDRKNIAPEADFSITSKKAVDIVILTDYTGAKLADLQNRLDDAKTTGLANGTDIKYTVIGDNAKIGTQSSQVTMNVYTRNIYFYYTQTNINGWQAPATLNKCDAVSYESCTLAPGESLPPLIKGTEVSMTTSSSVYQGMGWCYIGQYVTFYNPANYSATKTDFLLVEQFSSSYATDGSGYYVRSYSNFNFTPTNYWSYSSNYQQGVIGDISALDYSKLDSSLFRSGSIRYVLMLTDNTNTVSYKQSFGSYYPFATLRNDNLGDFINNNCAHAYAICDNSVADIKLSDSAYGVTYTNAASKQDRSIREIVNSSKDGRVYTVGKVQTALDNIVENTNKPENTNIDMVIATDQSDAVPATFLTNLKSNLNSNVDIDTNIIDADDTEQIDTLQIPRFKDIVKSDTISSYKNTSSYFVLDTDGNLYAKGYNYAWEYYQFSGQYEGGLFANSSVDEYTSYTKIMTGVKDFVIRQYYAPPAKYNAIVVLKKDGTVWGSGVNFCGILAPLAYDSNSRTYSTMIVNGFTQIEGLSDIKQISLTGCSNYNDYMQLTSAVMQMALLVCLSNSGKLYYRGYEAISALTPSGTLSNNSWLDSTYCDPYVTNASTFAIPTDASYYTGILIATKDGTLYAKGYYYPWVQNTNGYEKSNTYPVYLSNVSGYGSISEIRIFGSGNDVYMILDNRDLYIYSKNISYYNGTGSSTIAPTTPKKIISNVKKLGLLECSGVYVITNSNELYYWGISNYLPYCFLGYDGSQYVTTYINSPTRCYTITDVEDVYCKGITNSICYFKKTDGSFYIGGRYYPFEAFLQGTLTSTETYTYVNSYTPVKINPGSSLNVCDYKYFETTPNSFNLMAIDLSGKAFYSSSKNVYNSNTGAYDYVFQKADFEWPTAFCDYTAKPLYGIDTIKAMSTKLREASQRYFIYISNSTSTETRQAYGSYYPFSSLDSDLINYLKANKFNIYAVCPRTVLTTKLQTPNVTSNFQTKSIQDLLDSSSADSGGYSSSSALIDIISEKYFMSAVEGASKNYSIVAGEDTAEYSMLYNDYETDPKYSEQWMYMHDSTYFENSNGQLASSGQWVSSPIQAFTKVGKYTVCCKVRDNPKADIAFDDYKLWSALSPAFTLIVHRRPVAQFTAQLLKDTVTNKITPLLTDSSYDLDHQSEVDRGIVKWEWKYKVKGSSVWIDGKIPSSAALTQVYTVQLKVQDYEGAWSNPATHDLDPATVPVITNYPPTVNIIEITPAVIYDGDPITVSYKAFDRDYDKLTSTLQVLNGSNVVWSGTGRISPAGTAYPVSYANINSLTDGTYTFKATVIDPSGASATDSKVFTVNPLKIESVTIKGYWNHWRGQIDIFGKQMTNEAHRFLSYETVKVDVTTKGSPDTITVEFSPELQAMQFTDKYGNSYDYAEAMGSYVTFPLKLKMTSENTGTIEYTLPLAPSTVDENNVRLRTGYWMKITAQKGTSERTYILDGTPGNELIDITGNIYDHTYIQPVNE